MEKLIFKVHDQSWQLPKAEFIQFFTKRSRVAVVIPVLNEGDRFHRQLKSMSSISNNFDIIICDGGSADHSSDPRLLRELGVCAVIYKLEAGRMSSQLRLLFSKVLSDGYEFCIHMDGNEKDDPLCIERYHTKLLEGFDLVVGSRFKSGGINENTPLDRELAIRFIHAPLISLASGFWYTDTTNSFRGYSSRLLQDPRLKIFRSIFDSYNLPYYFLVMAPKNGFRCIEIAVNRRYKKGKKVVSKIIGWRGRWGIIKELFMTIFGKYNP